MMYVLIVNTENVNLFLAIVLHLYCALKKKLDLRTMYNLMLGIIICSKTRYFFFLIKKYASGSLVTDIII